MSDAPRDATPSSVDELGRVLADAHRDGLAVLPRGNGTRPGCGALPRRVDLVVDTSRLDRVVDYEPGDLTITVEAGMALADLDRVLAEHDQWLPLQPYRGAGTVGGLLATAADGAVDLGYGRPRDAIIGARIALADGTLARSRGRVVKNVAGYDLPRLLVGSLGTLGVLAEVSLKLRPRPARASVFVADFESTDGAMDAADAVIASPLEPVLVDVLRKEGEVRLLVGFDGTAARVDGLTERAVALVEPFGPARHAVLDGEEARAARRLLDDPVASLLAKPGPPRAAGSPTDRPVPRDDDGDHLVRWSGARVHLGRWAREVSAAAGEHGAASTLDARPGLGVAFLGLPGDDAVASRRTAREATRIGRQLGHAVLLAATDATRHDHTEVWGPPPPEIRLMQRVKDAMDPSGAFAPGRFVGGL